MKSLGERKKYRLLVQPMQELRTWGIQEIENNGYDWKETIGGM